MVPADSSAGSVPAARASRRVRPLRANAELAEGSLVKAARLAESILPLILGDRRLSLRPVTPVDLSGVESLGLQCLLARPDTAAPARMIAARRLEILVGPG